MKSTLPSATLLATAAAGAVLLTACGNDGDKPRDNNSIAGADQGAGTPQESTQAPVAPTEDKPDGVDVSLPKDMNLIFDWNKPTDKDEAAAMDDAANFVRAIYRGVDKGTTKDAAITTYATGEGLQYAETQIHKRVHGGWTATGIRRHYEATTRLVPSGTSVEVAFCVDSTRFYSKEVKTGKVLKSEPSIAAFDYFKIIMVKLPTGSDLWQASEVVVETKAAQCR